MNTEKLKEKLKTFFANNFRTLQYQEGYCTTCWFSEDVEALDERAFEDMLNEIDEWAKEEFGGSK